MKTKFILACFMLSLGFSGSAAGQDLPAEILADQYLLEATEAIEKGSPQTAIRAFEKIEALDTEPPVEFLFFYGKLLVEHGTTVEDVRKGEGLLKQFILNIENDAEQYTPTLKLLSVAGRKLEKIEAERREAERREAERREAERREAERREAERREAERRAKLKEQLAKLLQMVTVPGGTFQMGCTEERRSCNDAEKPVHPVQVPDFEISKYEMTQELWEAVMGKNPIESRNCPRCPVEPSWEDIQTFLEKLNALTGKRYRLPTEAEWEYAARGGQQSRGYKYAGSDTPGLVAWYAKNGGKRAHPVGQKAANELGLYDMSGNVWEWVEDCWNTSYRGAPRDGSAWTSGNCDKRVLRGGSWFNYPRLLRSAYRNWNGPGYPISSGFRVARTLTP